MEVFQTEKYYIFVKKENSLWWNRITSEFTIKAGWDLSSVDDIECIGITTGIVGIISLSGVYAPHLVIVKEAQPVGVLYPPHLVYKIKSICILSDDEPDTILIPCSRHSNSKVVQNTSSASKSRLFEGSQIINKAIWGAVKSAGSTIKNTTQHAAVLASNQMRSSAAARDPTKIEKRITDELHKMFDDSDSFYYCADADITHNLQRRNGLDHDERFFWNKHMLKDIFNLNDNSWILPVIQGFVQVENCVIGNDCFTLALVSRRSRYRAGTRYKRRGVDEHGYCANYVETEQILSFRQHQMSFTQVRGSVPVFWSQPGYKYRPPPRLDKDEGETCAAFEKHFDEELLTYKGVCIVNLVEQSGKEKVIFDAYGQHILKYNNENLIYVAFDFHDYCRGMRFENVSALIEAVAPEAGAMGFHWQDAKGTICCQKSVFRVNCMDCLDRTNVVQTAMGKAVLESQLVKLGLAPPYSPIPEQLKSPFMILWANNGDIISRQYAGTNALKGDYTRTGERKFTGLVKDGMNSANRYIIQHFADTFRQGIIDLMLGQLIDASELRQDDPFDTLVAVVGSAVLPAMPTVPSTSCMRHVTTMSIIGTEMRLFEELLSFTSYYLARFKDTYRQATIDLMLGNHVSAESLNALGGQTAPDEGDALEGAEHARLLVEDCRRMLLGSAQFPIGAWGLIDADPTTGDPNETEVDSILLLTDEFYMVAEYDSHLDKIIRFEKVLLANVTVVESGVHHHTKMFHGASGPHLCIRINYAVAGVDGYFHMFRSPNIRFFNNVAVIIKTPEEVSESLLAILECFRIALENRGKGDVQFLSCETLQRRKSRTPMLDVPKGIPRNLSESQLVQIGSKALSNVAGQFSKLGQSLNPTKIRSVKRNRNNSNPQVVYNPSTSSGVLVDAKDEKVAEFTMGDGSSSSGSNCGGGGGGGKKHHDSSGSDSDDNDCSIYEPDDTDLVQENPIYNENAFLPSVGIVMASNDATANDYVQPKRSADVCTMSITSVTDHINMPAGMLEHASPIRGRSPAPEIRVDDMASTSDISNLTRTGFSQSSSEMRFEQSPTIGAVKSQSMQRDLSLNLSGSQSDNALKQLKTLTSPLSKLAKGMQNFGINLDPRKIKTPVSTQPYELPAGESEAQKLQEQWDACKCKTKLIAL